MKRKETSTTRLSRREALVLGMSAGGALAAGAFPKPAIAQGYEPELVFACDGGSTQRIFEQQFFPEFTAKTGTKIVYVAGQPSDTLAKMRAQKGNVPIDAVWMAGGMTFQSIDEGYMADIDRSLVPSAALIPASAGVEKGAIPVGITVCSILNNTDVFAKRGFPQSTSWFDLWDPRYKGHVGSYSINVTSGIALLAKITHILTGDYKNLDAGFAKFKELRSNMLDFYPSAGAWETAFQQGDAWIGMNTAVRCMQMKIAGLPAGHTIPKEGTVGYQTWLGITKSAKAPKAAHAFIEYMVSAAGQAKMAQYIGYEPVNREVKPPADRQEYFPEISTVLVPDWRYLSTMIPKIVERWNREVER
jgi:putative spermidine/putrescine transport system substrate-binding protein